MHRDEVDQVLRKLIFEEPQKFCAKPPPLIKQPTFHKARISIWVDVQMKDVREINSAGTVEELRKKLGEIFDIKDYEENKRSAILIDLYTYVAQFGKKNCFDAEQTSAIFSIFKKTHEICSETPFGNFEHCIQFFKDMIFCHSIRRPPFSIDLFTPQEAQKILEYGTNSYFRHFKLYKYAFTPKVSMDLKLNYDGASLSPPTEHDVCGTMSPTGEAGEAKMDADAGSVQGAEVTSELKSLIRKHLMEELKQLKLSMEEKIKQAEDEIERKLESSDSQQKVQTSKTEKSKLAGRKR